MTRQPDRDGRDPARPAGGASPPEETPEPPAIQINAPEDSPPGSAPEAPASGQSSVESMLHDIMARIDKTDRKYAHALDDLYSRLNDLAARADSARAHGSNDAAEALGRLSGQAGSLADQVREADTRYQAPRDDDAVHGARPHGGETARHGEASASTPETSAGPHDAGSPDMSADMADIGQYFADVTARLERSFASDSGTADPDALSARMDDLARRFDEALATKSDLAALHSIESQLESLADSFASTREQFNRLDGIEHELRALSQRNHQVDLRTVEALEVMNTSLQSLVESLGAGQQAAAESPAPEAAQTQTPPSRPDRGAEVWIETEDHRDATADFASRTADAASAGTADGGDATAGAGVPPAGDQPRQDETRPPETMQELADKAAENRAPEPANTPAEDTADPPAPRYRSSEDLIASLRREASKAPTQIREPDGEPAQSRQSGRDSPLAFLKRGRSTGTAAEEESDARPPRSRLVAIAIFLLLVSASLFYSRLHDALVPFGDFLPQQSAPPASGANGAAGDTGNAARPDPARGRQPEGADAPDVRTDKRMNGDASTAPAMPARLQPSGVRTNTPSVAPSAPGPSMGGSWQPLKRETVESPFPGVTMAIEEPGAPAQGGPDARSGGAVDTSGPTLVPATQTPSSAQDGPRRVSVPGKAPDAQAGNASGGPQDGALPAGIGPQSLRAAAAKGNPAAQFEVAARFATGDGADPAKAAEWYSRAAAQGFAPAQYRLAVLHERGLGVKKDPGRARTWYRRAAELGNVKAMHNLAVMHGRPGSGTPDYATAQDWFLAAGRHGLVDSQYNLGVLNENGLGVPPNPEDAYKWYSLAADGGDAEAGKRAERMRQKLSAAAIKRVDEAVRAWEPLEHDAKANAERFGEADWSEADAGGADKPKPVTIARVQFLLNKLGYDAGDPDGLMGPKTKRAIRNFEAGNGSGGSGKVTPELLSRLEAAAG